MNFILSLSCLTLYSVPRTKALNKEKKRTDTLLYQMIPKPIAEQLKQNESVSAEAFSESSIFFSDIVGFTAISSRSSPIQVLHTFHPCLTLTLPGPSAGVSGSLTVTVA